VRLRESATIVFSGDAEQVSVGFALALAVMVAHENLLITSREWDPKGTDAIWLLSISCWRLCVGRGSGRTVTDASMLPITRGD
jgi:hypothetical protein